MIQQAALVVGASLELGVVGLEATRGAIIKASRRIGRPGCSLLTLVELAIELDHLRGTD